MLSSTHGSSAGNTERSSETTIAVKVAAAVFSFRGTRLNKAGNLQADLHLMKDLNAEMMVTQRASKKIQSHIRRLQEQYQSVKWSFYTTGIHRYDFEGCCGLTRARLERKHHLSCMSD